MLTLNDGRSELWQWDTGRKLTVDADCTQVHFSNKVFGRSIDVDAVDGIAIIPDILLQTDKELTAWAFVGTAENGYTKISKTFKVNRRNKPADYVFTPHDQTTLAEIMERLDELESIQDPDAIKNAVDDYLANNPIEVEETDPTVPDWAKQPEPPKVEIPEVNIPTTLPNPNALTFTGAVEATYDGSVPVEVVIPEGGARKWKKVYSCYSTTITEPVTAIEIDLGVPELGDIEEFDIYWYNSKSTLETVCSGQWTFTLDGMLVGYYAFNDDGKKGRHIDIYGDIGRGVIQLVRSVNSTVYNTISILQQRSIGPHEPTARDGKLKVTIPTEWAGEYGVTVFTR